MCLAIPMEVVEVRENVARVRTQGVEKEIFLDIVDRFPEVGEYVVVHAGFAIHTVDRQAAQESLRFFDEMARGAGQAGEGEDAVGA